MNTLPKSERLHGKTTISALMSKGRWGHTSALKYCYLAGEGSDDAPAANRMMVSVPKKLFKRAVKRNLLKRRLREAYRTSKDLLPQTGASIMFLYGTDRILEADEIKEHVTRIMKSLSDERQQ